MCEELNFPYKLKNINVAGYHLFWMKILLSKKETLNKMLGFLGIIAQTQTCKKFSTKTSVKGSYVCLICKLFGSY